MDDPYEDTLLLQQRLADELIDIGFSVTHRHNGYRLENPLKTAVQALNLFGAFVILNGALPLCPVLAGFPRGAGPNRLVQQAQRNAFCRYRQG